MFEKIKRYIEKKKFYTKTFGKKFLDENGVLTIPEGVEVLSHNMFKENGKIKKVVCPKA